MSDVLVRFISKEVSAPSDGRLLTMAEAAARWRIMSAQRTETRRRRLLVGRRVSVDEILMPDPEGLDPHERALLRAAVDMRMARLTPAERRAVMLLRRGGSYTSAERVAIHRSRANLGEHFRDLLGAIAVACGRWRNRLVEPHPALPIMAGAISAVTHVGFAMSNAAVHPQVGEPPRSPPALARAQRVRQPPHLLQRRSPEFGARFGTPTTYRLPRTNPPSALATSVARLPIPERAGEASVALVRAPTNSSTIVAVTVKCDSSLRRAVCERWAGVE
ncbi:MAG TPA: hypothetical protein VGO92_00215 [Acidimicrobiales bacterium]|jgi:hypothetical protein|nr:hypothetical protein [Acidimicrobiales bacterium]